MILCRGVAKTDVVRERRGLLRRGECRKIEALRILDLEVQAGEFVGLLGRNEAGKTTLLFPTRGEVCVAKIDAIRPRCAAFWAWSWPGNALSTGSSRHWRT